MPPKTLLSIHRVVAILVSILTGSKKVDFVRLLQTRLVF